MFEKLTMRMFMEVHIPIMLVGTYMMDVGIRFVWGSCLAGTHMMAHQDPTLSSGTACLGALEVVVFTRDFLMKANRSRFRGAPVIDTAKLLSMVEIPETPGMFWVLQHRA